jgi:hypothetical protein
MGFMMLIVGLPFMAGQMCGVADPTNSQPQPQDQTGDAGSQAGDAGSTTPPVSDRLVVGPEFSLSVPGQFNPYSGAIAPARARHVDAYYDGERLLTIWTETPVADGCYRFDATGTCIQEALKSDSGAFVLLAITSEAFSGAEDLAGYALLAGGDLLCVEVCAGRPLTADDRALGTAILQSISLNGTDGRVLEDKIKAHERQLLGCTSEGIIVLDDLSAWRVSDNAADSAAAEIGSWVAGDAVHHQSTGDEHYLLTIGRWTAVPVRDLGLAIQTTIVAYDQPAGKLVLGNGQTRTAPFTALPPVWKMGDEVLMIHDEGHVWLVRPRTWHVIRL